MHSKNPKQWLGASAAVMAEEQNSKIICYIVANTVITQLLTDDSIFI